MRKLILSSVVLVFLLGSCTTLKQIIGLTANPPKVKMLSAEWKTANLQNIELNLNFEIDNDNDVDLEFKSLRYEIFIFDIALVKDVFKESVVAKAEAKSLFSVPLRIPTEKAGAVMAKAFTSGLQKAVLKIKAQTTFVTNMGEIDVEFDDEKKLSEWK